MTLRYDNFTPNGDKFWFNISKHFQQRLQKRFGMAHAPALKDTLILLEEKKFDFGGDEEFVVRDFKNDTVVVYSETYKKIKGIANQTLINLITGYVGKNGAENFNQAPYTKVIVFDKHGNLVNDVPMQYDDYLSWFYNEHNRHSVHSWKWPKAWSGPKKYLKKVEALRKNVLFCQNINSNLTKYPPPNQIARNNIINSAK